MSSGVYNRHTGHHNRKSIRLRGYDYSQPGRYFITICSKHRAHLFGDVINGKMVLNDAGLFAQECLVNIPVHFPHVALDECIVMPNHVHAIIAIREMPPVPMTVSPVLSVPPVGVQNFEPLREERREPPREHRRESPRKTGPQRNEFQHIIPKSLGSVVRGFKIGVTKWHRQSKPGMVVWQRNYHDHIIRDDASLHFIRNYIRENPLHWIGDMENHIDNEIDEFDLEEVQGGKLTHLRLPHPDMSSESGIRPRQYGIPAPMGIRMTGLVAGWQVSFGAGGEPF
jgi:REP element-mobilizing transposase RayT